MPYITNDSQSIFVDSKEFAKNAKEYRGYTVARKLFVSLSTPMEKWVNKEKNTKL